jgi:hypothetical protein
MTSSDLEPDERKSNSSSEDSSILLRNALRFGLSVEDFALSGPSVFTKAVLPKSSQSFPEPIFGARKTERSGCETGFRFNAERDCTDGKRTTEGGVASGSISTGVACKKVYQKYIRQISLDGEVMAHFVNEVVHSS